MRISEKLAKYQEKNPNKPSFSYEFFVPKTFQGTQNLYERMERMYDLTSPQFIDITWNAGGSTSVKTTTPSNSTSSSSDVPQKKKRTIGSLEMTVSTTTDIIETCQTVLGLETCMHLTCTNMPLSEIDEALEKAYESGCQNILALRGDPPLGGVSQDENIDGTYFQYAKDLVCYIKSKYGDHFDIGIAGYPEGHPEESSSDKLLDYLVEKVECGANFIITQMFYDSQLFIEWCSKIRQRGVTVPIIPGIMPITSYDSFLRRAKWCQINVPKKFIDSLSKVQDDDQLVREVGNDLLVEMCEELLKSNYVKHLHIYTMNLEKSSMVILQKIGILKSNFTNKYINGSDSLFENNSSTQIGWKKSLNPGRKNEQVRPIFWTRRPYSYVARTSEWGVDEFPNGRFGDPNSPAFGGLDLAGSQLIRQTGKKTLELWGEPQNLKDFSKLITNYLSGDLKVLPWSDSSITNEADSILHYLKDLNKHSIFTINSQPKVNGLPSNDKIFGWGPKNGFVYQKGYLEFLLPIEKLSHFLELVKENDELTFFVLNQDNSVFYYKNDENEIVNESIDTSIKSERSLSESSTSSNEDDNSISTIDKKKKKINQNKFQVSRANAVTWGIFPGREVVQPTIVEKASFIAWRDEFYQILKEWKWNIEKKSTSTTDSTPTDSTSKETQASNSGKFIQSIIDGYLLCNVVDNNFVSPENQVYSLLSELYN